jgi:hypothetical protein
MKWRNRRTSEEVTQARLEQNPEEQGDRKLLKRKGGVSGRDKKANLTMKR